MKKYIKLLLLILCMMMIFHFSCENSQESMESSNFVVELIYRIFSIFIKSISLEDFMKFYGPFIRKLAHFSEFCLLGMLSYLNAIEYRKNNVILLSISFCILYATSDELHQLFVPNRCCSIIDIGIDTIGSLCGIIFVHLLIKRCLKKL